MLEGCRFGGEVKSVVVGLVGRLVPPEERELYGDDKV